MKPKKRALVVCPGRGSYTKDSLGYLSKRGIRISSFLQETDQKREALKRPAITELDQMSSFKPSLHTKGEHASSLIYACSFTDYSQINLEEYEPVAITGNSMGWYTACALAGVLSPMGAFEVIETMGSMMLDKLIGGQLIYPVCRNDWTRNLEEEAQVLQLVKEANSNGGFAQISIFLGGYLVIGANGKAMEFLMGKLPKKDKYPFQLINHGAFHTSLLKEVSNRAFESLSLDLFKTPKIDLIDGRGFTWKPYSTGLREVYNYTLGHQVCDTYSFTLAIEKGLKEYNPDCIILLGPGNSLGGSIGQILVDLRWKGLKSKSNFSQLQKTNPFIYSMGIEEQYQKVSTKGE